MCAIDTALTVDEVLDTFTSALSINPVGRGWALVPAHDYEDRITGALGVAAADPAPSGRAPRLVCAVVSSYSHHRTVVYIGAMPGTPTGVRGAIFTARQLIRTGRLLVRRDPDARWTWEHPARSPLAQLAG
ncbi:MAG TPA: hypothetical protein VFY45_18430 [Baekduia sp.]|nr:hypothetical protein [Baekduia sp.]